MNKKDYAFSTNKELQILILEQLQEINDKLSKPIVEATEEKQEVKVNLNLFKEMNLDEMEHDDIKNLVKKMNKEDRPKNWHLLSKENLITELRGE